MIPYRRPLFTKIEIAVCVVTAGFLSYAFWEGWVGAVCVVAQAVLQ
jgi:hypothetical protein